MQYKYHNGSGAEAQQIFVFGSNLAGIHGAGAARFAYEHYGAYWGIGYGVTGISYAIPTKEQNVITPRFLYDIKISVEKFLIWAKRYSKMSFFVTRIGCGLAGYTDEQVAPMFKGAPVNCVFPIEWKEYLE